MRLIDLTKKEASLFENYQPDSYNDLLVSLQIADERITSRIAKTQGDWTKRKLNEIKGYINDQIGDAYGGLFAGVQHDSAVAAEVVLSANATAAGVNGKVSKSVLKDITNPNRQIQGYGFKELFDVTSDNHARQLRVVVASGVAQGMTTDQIIREYNIKSDKLSKGQVKSNIFTAISESRDLGRYDAYKQLEASGAITGYIYDATLDGRTSQYCREHDQRVYRKKLEDIQSEIKVHFNCRSVFRPITDETEQDERASINGVVKEQSYEDWFKQQSKGFQSSTLTNRRYKDFLDGKYKVKGLTDLNKNVNLTTIKKYLK